MINEQRVKEWTTHLRNTELGQAVGTLIEVNSGTGEVVGACCLGVGEVECAGADLAVLSDNVSDRDHPYAAYVDGHRQPGLPTLLPVWLGAAADNGLAGDLWVDTAPVFTYVQTNGVEGTFEDTYNPAGLPCSLLNDVFGLSFAQIADMVDYFGLRDMS